MTKFPTNLNELGKAFQREAHVNERTGWIFVVGAHPLIVFFARVLTQLWNKARFRMIQDPQEAYEVLKAYDATLEFSQLKTEQQETK